MWHADTRIKSERWERDASEAASPVPAAANGGGEEAIDAAVSVDGECGGSSDEWAADASAPGCTQCMVTWQGRARACP
jgi:hypothetical protein